MSVEIRGVENLLIIYQVVVDGMEKGDRHGGTKARRRKAIGKEGGKAQRHREKRQ